MANAFVRNQVNVSKIKTVQRQFAEMKLTISIGARSMSSIRIQYPFLQASTSRPGCQTNSPAEDKRRVTRNKRFPQTLRVKLLRFFMVGSVICTVFALLLLYCSFETLQYAYGGDYVRYWGDFSVFPLCWYCRHPCANACQVLHTLFLFNLRSTDPKYGVKIMKRMCKHCLPGTAVQV